MGLTGTSEIVEDRRRPLGVRHALLVFVSPRALFERVEDTGAYGWSLVTLVGLVLLLGYAEVQTGLTDRVVDQRTEKALADLEQAQGHLVDRIELKEQMDSLRQRGEFDKMLSRMGVIVFTPLWLLASFMLIASALYAAVALTGRKPEYHTLMSICVYGGFVVLFGRIVRLAMVIFYRTADMDTSLGMMSVAGEPSPLSAVDPFRIWFWVLAAMGLVVTRQLGKRMAVATCLVMALVAAGVRVAMAYAG